MLLCRTCGPVKYQNLYSLLITTALWSLPNCHVNSLLMTTIHHCWTIFFAGHHQRCISSLLSTHQLCSAVTLLIIHLLLLNTQMIITSSVIKNSSDLCLSVEGAFAFCTLVILTILQTHMPAIIQIGNDCLHTAVIRAPLSTKCSWNDKYRCKLDESNVSFQVEFPPIFSFWWYWMVCGFFKCLQQDVSSATA